jgi:PAS domain S-box-containing protein
VGRLYSLSYPEVALLNAPSDSAFLIDIEGIVVATNKIAAKRLGVSVDQFLGMNVYDLLPPALAKSRKTKFERVINSGKPRHFIDKRAGIVFDVSVYPVFDEEGKVVQLAVHGKDITNERKALQTLKTKEKQLEARTRSLEDANTALSVLLRRREEDRTDLEERVFSNLKTLVRPHMERLKESPLNTEQETCLNALESGLGNIISPFARELSSTLLDLTPMEIRVASLVREGKSNKGIAEHLSLSKNTILSHRFHLRRKLGIKNKKINLRSHLLSFQ